jgi:uncharacterized protein (TIGR00251 family)
VNIQQHGNAVTLSVYVQPRASRSEIVGEHGDALKVRLAAPPVDGAANEELIRFAAKLFGVSASSVSIRSGQASRTKLIEITGVTTAEVAAVIETNRKPRG